jgi:hypothetical protein
MCYTSWVCVCRLKCPTLNAHAQYFHLWPAQIYNIFPCYLTNGTIFGKRSNWTRNGCFHFLYNFVSNIFILGRTERNMNKNVYWSSCKVLVILVRFKWNLNFLSGFSKNIQISNCMKIRQVGAEMFHADRRTDGRRDMTKLIVAFRYFANSQTNFTYEFA